MVDSDEDEKDDIEYKTKDPVKKYQSLNTINHYVWQTNTQRYQPMKLTL